VLEKLGMFFESRAKTRFSNKANLAECVAEADLVIGAVLIPGAAAPKLVTREMLGTMKPGAVLVDVAIDQGGCFETSKATTHAAPTYVVDGIVHYCVANMPGGVARTSTYALNNVTLPHALRIANKGWKAALLADPHLRNGLNVWNGKVTYRAVAEDLGYDYVTADAALAA
jgi:alanine dehydrogenase